MTKAKLTYEELEKRCGELELENQNLNSKLLLQEEYENFFSCTVDLLCIANTDGYFLRLNKEWENSLGYSIRDLEGKRFLDFVHPDDLEATYHAIDQLDKQIAVLNFTNRYQRKDGTYRWIEWKSYPKGNKIYAAARDISERILMENELIKTKEKAEESEAKFHAIFLNSKVVKLLIDAESGQIIDANPTAVNFYGYEKAQLLSLKISDINELHQKQIEDDISLIYKGIKHTYYRKHRKATGELVDVEVYSSLIKIKERNVFYSLILDVTEKNKVQEELVIAKEKAEESRALLSAFMEYVPALILIKDSESRPIFANKAFERFFPADEWLHKTPTESFPAHIADEMIKQDKDAMNKGYVAYEETWDDKFAATHHYYTQKFKIEIPGRKLLLGSIITDISQLKEIENQLIAAKEKAQESELKYKNIVKIIPDGILLHQQGQIVFANEAAAKILKAKSSDDFIGIPVLDFVHPDFRESVVNRIKNSLLNNVIAPTNEETLIDFEGNPVFCLITASPFSYQGKPTILVEFTDIGKLKKTELDILLAKEKAEESEDFISTIFENIPNMVFVKNADDLRFVRFNKAGEQLLGYKKEDLIGKNDYDFFPKEQADFFTSKDREVFNKNEIVTIEEEQIQTKNGIKTLFTRKIGVKDKKGNFKYLLGISEDITEKKITERELITAKEKAEENEKKLLSIYNTVGNVIYQVSVEANDTYRFVSVNSEFLAVTGLKMEQILGKTVREIIPEPSVDIVISNYKKAISEKALVHWEETSTYPTGDLTGIVSVAPIFDASDNCTFLVGAVHDITDRKRIEIELINSKEKAEESDRLKTAFLHNMSHEIRTPLNSICGFSGMLNKPNLSDEKRKKFTSIIQNSGNQLLSIVMDILTISSLETKLEKLKESKVCINSIILDLLLTFKPQAIDNNILLCAKQQLSNTQSEIYTDKTKLTHILTNLLANALKFTHEGFVEFGYNLSGNELVFFVKDSGIGIKPEFHEKIFERFSQADKSINRLYGGTGLGLAISKAFVELLGGRIWVHSEIEKGSIFYFTIPYKPVNEIDKHMTHAKQNENFKTVLVAEDEEYNFLFIEELLIDTDLKLIHAKDGRETVDIFKSNSNIDLILMDIKMPIMDGHESAKIIKGIKPSLPIVAQSAYALEHEREKYEGIFDDYLTKPINENDLIQTVMKYIDFKRA